MQPERHGHDGARNVLIVTYHFPPDAAGGALRWQKFSKYLPTSGWSPFVLTGEAKYYESVDPARLADPSAGRVWRTTRIPNPRVVLRLLKGALVGLTTQRAHQPPRSGRQHEEPRRPADTSQRGVLTSARRTVLSLCWVPDDFLGWLPMAIVRGILICRRVDIRVIVTSGPPHTCRLLDLLVLLSQAQPDQIPAKAFEYLAAGPPILAVTDDGATADLVRDVGEVVVDDSPAMIKEAIERAYLSYLAARPNGAQAASGKHAKIHRYDRRYLAAQLAAVLEDVA